MAPHPPEHPDDPTADGRTKSLPAVGPESAPEETPTTTGGFLPDLHGRLHPPGLPDTRSAGGASARLPPDVPALPGYELLDVLGHGGMGVVYKAVQTRLKRTVAVKVLVGGGYVTRGAADRFRVEAEAVAALDHPNVVRVYDSGEHAGVLYLAMEYAPGGSLRDRLAAGPLPIDDAVRLVEALARAVAVAHAAGIVHRDLKPANILFDAEGTPKVADFGLAKRMDDPGLTVTGAILGSPSYMAPEQAAGDIGRVGPWTDVYGLGSILYECLTRRPPFAGENAIATMDLVRFGELTPPRAASPRVPRDVEAVCLRCLVRDPAGRYASAGDLAADLGRCLRGEPPLALRRRPGHVLRGALPIVWVSLLVSAYHVQREIDLSYFLQMTPKPLRPYALPVAVSAAVPLGWAVARVARRAGPRVRSLSDKLQALFWALLAAALPWLAAILAGLLITALVVIVKARHS